MTNTEPVGQFVQCWYIAFKQVSTLTCSTPTKKRSNGSHRHFKSQAEDTEQEIWLAISWIVSALLGPYMYRSPFVNALLVLVPGSQEPRTWDCNGPDRVLHWSMTETCPMICNAATVTA